MDNSAETVQFLSQIERKLGEALADPPTAGPTVHADTLMGAARHLCLGAGGKRIRPLLARLFGQACGASLDAAVTVGVSAEMVHSASLLHDDVVDAGMFRRGRPTVNALWGNIVAVMAGDMLLTLAIGELESLRREVTHLAVATVAEMTRSTIAEVEARGDLSLPVERFRAIAEGKTGALFAYCGGAMGLEVADAEAVRRFSLFGRHLGVAFQFADDLRDLDGTDPGKPRFADIKSRTPSLPILLAAAADEPLRRRLKDLWAFGSMPDDRVKEVGQAILRSSAPEQAVERVRAEVSAAEDALGPYARSGGGQELVSWGRRLAESVSDRKAE